MGQKELRSYDYVNHSYEKVRDALSADAAGVFRDATKAATSRAESVAAELSISVGGLQIGTEIAVTIGEIEEDGPSSFSRVTRIPVQWSAAERPGLFPLMSAVLSVYPLTATETQLDFEGRYEPPLGLMGEAVDAVIGHRIADASVKRFIAKVAQYLRENLPSD